MSAIETPLDQVLEEAIPLVEWALIRNPSIHPNWQAFNGGGMPTIQQFPQERENWHNLAISGV